MKENQKNINYPQVLLLTYLSVSGLLDALLFHCADNVIYALIGVMLMVAIPLIINRFHLRVSNTTLYLILIFTAVSVYTGNRYNWYKTFWFYDIALHLLSGVLIALTGADLFFPEKKTKKNLPFILFFSFIFTLAMAGLWEITEFLVDVITGNDVQRNLLWEKELIGRSWQNNGIRDTMNDMINGCIGGLIGCLIILMSVCHKEKLHEK